MRRGLRFILPILLLLALPLSRAAAGEELRCEVCNKKIAGRYVVLKRGEKKVALCTACARKVQADLEKARPVCDVCGNKITGPYVRATKDGHPVALCPTCAKAQQAKAPACSLCGKPIHGTYIKYDDGTRYCAACQKTYRCPRCGRPLGKTGGREKGGTRFCTHCVDAVHVCGACGEAITGVFYKHPFADGVYCARCEREREHCSVCARPIPADAVKRIGQNRPFCPACFRQAIRDSARLEAILRESITILKDALALEVYHPLPVELVTDIQKIRKEAGYGETHGKELGLFKRKGETFRIFILDGLSEAMAYETVPHEWGHAWFAENGHARHPQWIEEGFCQWVASRILKKKGLTAQLQVLRTRDDMYGKGYRFLAALEKKGGTQAVLEYIRQPPPAGND